MTMWGSSRATVEPHSRDTHLIWTPPYNRQLFSQQIAKHIFLKYGHQSIQITDTFLCLNRKLLHIVQPTIWTLVTRTLAIFIVTIM